MAFIIVKHAGSSWEYYFKDDPKEGKVHSSHSAHLTFSGQCAGIKEKYEDKKEAEKDCNKMNINNPIGDYGVCELLEVTDLIE